MALGKKSGGKDFKKGNVPKSPGRPKMPETLKNLQRLTKTSFEEIVTKYIFCSLDQLAAFKKRTDIPAMDAWIVAIVFKGITTGDWGGNEWIAQRLIGKVKDQVDVTVVKPFVVNNLDGSQMVLGVTQGEET